jgi:GNAT superfamily N-acetyltransferase
VTYTAIAMGTEHKDAVLKLWRETLFDAQPHPHPRPRGAADAGDRYPWFYEQNPSGRAATWLGVVEPGRQIIGCGSTYPRTTLVAGEPLRGGVLSDFAVDKAHRIAGCAVAIQRAIVDHSRETGYDFLYGYPNHCALPVIQRVGYEVLGFAVPYSKPLQTGHRLRGQIKNRRLAEALGRPEVAELLGLVVDLGLATLDLGRMLHKLVAYRVEQLPRADARFDELWARRASSRVMGEKTARYLNWRYASHQGAEYRFFCLVERQGGRLAGYLVYSIEDNKAFVADLFTPCCDETVDHLLLHFAMRMRREQRAAIYLSYFGGEAFGKRLEALQFFRRPPHRRVILFAGKHLPAATVAVLRNRDNWFMLDGELDV